MDLKSTLIVEDVKATCIESLNSQDIRVAKEDTMPKQELWGEINTYEALGVCSKTRLIGEAGGADSKLQVDLGQVHTGENNIDINGAEAKHVEVAKTSASGDYALSTTELTCGMILALARNVVSAAVALKAGRSDHTMYTGTELKGKILAIVGLSRVGKDVALRMHTFGMTIIGYDPFLTAEQCLQFHTIKMDLKDIWPLADYIALYSLVESKIYFINASILKMCKRGVKIISVSNGVIFKESDLIDALNSKHVGGAALNIFKQQLPTDSSIPKIIQHPAVITTTPLDHPGQNDEKMATMIIYLENKIIKDAKIMMGCEYFKEFFNNSTECKLKKIDYDACPHASKMMQPRRAYLNYTKIQNENKYHYTSVKSSGEFIDEILETDDFQVIEEDDTGFHYVNMDMHFDKVDTETIKTREYIVLSMIELTCCFLLSLARHVVPAISAMKGGQWNKAKYTGTELKGKTLAILGLGPIGSEIARRMHAFGMKIIGWDRFVTAEQCQKFHTKKMELEEIWPLADYIALHSLIDSSKNFINASVLRQCKRGVKIISVGRCAQIDIKDLITALNSRQVSGAALDIFDQKHVNNPLALELIQHPAVIVTPQLNMHKKKPQAKVD